jgi:hypothetical protein
MDGELRADRPTGAGDTRTDDDDLRDRFGASRDQSYSEVIPAYATPDRLPWA